MAAYTMKSDRFFVGSNNIDDGIQVYELDSLYMVPVKSKHWNYSHDLNIKVGNKYEALKIGDKEIWGDHLETLTKDLYNSGLMVNREGLCFLPTSSSAALEMDLEYYRLFDLYDWSKYGVKTLLTTRWARRDIVYGRPLDIVESMKGDGSGDDSEYKVELREKEKEWGEEKKKYEARVDEVEYQMEVGLRKKRMEIDRMKAEFEVVEGKREEELKEMEKMKREHQEVLEEIELRKQEELKRMNKEELDALEQRKGEELMGKLEELDEESKGKGEENEKMEQVHEDELEEAEFKNQEELKMSEEIQLQHFEEELELYVFKRSGLSSTAEFFTRIADKLWTHIPLVQISVNLDYKRSNWPPTGPPNMVIPLSSIEPDKSSSLPQRTLLCSSIDHEYIYFDCQNWRVMEVAVPTLSETELDYAPTRWTMAYYEGSSDFTYLASSYDQRVSFPSPCPPENIKDFGPLDLKHIVGVGTRLVYFYTAFNLTGDGM